MTSTRTIAYTLHDGEVTGGNVVAAALAEAALGRGLRVIVLSPQGGAVCDRLRSAGAEVSILGGRRTFRLDTALEFARALRRGSVDLLHTHDALPGTVLARLGARISRTPVVSHVHVQTSYHSDPLVRAWQKALWRATNRAACDAVIVVSSSLQEEALREGVRHDRVFFVPNGVRTTIPSGKRQAQRATLGVGSDDLLVLHVGRLCESKGQAVLLRALAQLQDPGVRVLCVGKDLEANGEYARMLSKLVRDLKVEDRARILGFVDAIEDVYTACDVLALPSTIEGTPLVVLEAMAAGKPVVATPVGGVPEVVIQDKTGILVPPGDAAALARALERLRADPALARQLGQAGAAKANAEHSVDAMVDATFRIYDLVLSRREVRADG